MFFADSGRQGFPGPRGPLGPRGAPGTCDCTAKVAFFAKAQDVEQDAEAWKTVTLETVSMNIGNGEFINLLHSRRCITYFGALLTSNTATFHNHVYITCITHW